MDYGAHVVLGVAHTTWPGHEVICAMGLFAGPLPLRGVHGGGCLGLANAVPDTGGRRCRTWASRPVWVPRRSRVFEGLPEFLSHLAVGIFGQSVAHANDESDRPVDDLGGR